MQSLELSPGLPLLHWDFPPALGTADPLSASEHPLHLTPSLPLPLLLSPPPTDLEKREFISIGAKQVISINSQGSMGPNL